MHHAIQRKKEQHPLCPRELNTYSLAWKGLNKLWVCLICPAQTITDQSCALWDGLNIICLLAQLQVLSEQISIKPSRYCQVFLYQSQQKL